MGLEEVEGLSKKKRERKNLWTPTTVPGREEGVVECRWKEVERGQGA